MLEDDPAQQKDVSADYPFLMEQMIEKAKGFDKEVHGKQ
jgi:hypothetical protein